jgi:predicted nucleotidyltransferase
LGLYRGAIAQLGERLDRTQEVVGSSPTSSTQVVVYLELEEDTGVIDEALIGEVGRRLAAAAPGARVILFGSSARGSTGPHSDLDLLVVEPSVQSPDDESVRLRRELSDVLVSMDIIVVSEDYVEQWRDVRGSLVNAAFSDGRVLAA